MNLLEQVYASSDCDSIINYKLWRFHSLKSLNS